MTRSEMIESVDWNRVRDEETVPILNLISKTSKFQKEQSDWSRDFNMECFIIMDHMDFILAETFNNHERRDRR
jgi:hypothetical protein